MQNNGLRTVIRLANIFNIFLPESWPTLKVNHNVLKNTQDHVHLINICRKAL